jgi:dual specificity tyrosine-phosphorylation-regulated kinase 1
MSQRSQNGVDAMNTDHANDTNSNSHQQQSGQTQQDSSEISIQQQQHSDEQGGGQQQQDGQGGQQVIMIRHPHDRPLYKLSVRLIDTYKHINKIYYQARAQQTRSQNELSGNRGGVHNDGYDDQQYDYILKNDEIFHDRYLLRHRIGKGSFGQVVCAYDQQTNKDVAIKIIKSRRPFMVQAQTEIALLDHILVQDPNDEHNMVRMINKFVFRNHQCVVFEMLSYNLYELLKTTR